MVIFLPEIPEDLKGKNEVIRYVYRTLFSKEIDYPSHDCIVEEIGKMLVEKVRRKKTNGRCKSKNSKVKIKKEKWASLFHSKAQRRKENFSFCAFAWNWSANFLDLWIFLRLIRCDQRHISYQIYSPRCLLNISRLNPLDNCRT